MFVHLYSQLFPNMKKQEILETIQHITAAAKSPTNTFLCNGAWLSQEAAILFWTRVLEREFNSPFIGQIRYVKRLDSTYSKVSYNKVLQQFDGETWNDVDEANISWETPKQEEKYNKAQAKEYQFR